MENEKKSREEYLEDIEEAERPVLESLKLIGIEIDDISDLINKYTDLPEDVVCVLLKWLPAIKQHNIQNMVIRAIGNTKCKYDGMPLATLFEKSDGIRNNRWAIANTIAISKPMHINEWVTTAVKNKKYGKSREMLCDAIAKMLSYGEAVAVLQAVFDDLPAHSAIALGRIGKESSVNEFLERKKAEIENEISLERFGNDCKFIPQENVSYASSLPISISEEELRRNYLKLSLKTIGKAIRKIEKRIEKK